MNKKMFNITKKTKVIAYTPAGYVTGGVELLHQVVDVINRNGGNAYVVYHGDKPHTVPFDYQKYSIKIMDEIEDIPENIIIIPEVEVNAIKLIKKAQVLLWWMSVDNYFTHLQGGTFENFQYRKLFAIKRMVKRFGKVVLRKKSDPIFSLKKIKEDNRIICNAYQSEYAKTFLLKNKISNIAPLKDFINDDFSFEKINVHDKKDYVIYNPNKGYSFTKKLINEAPELQWKPIQNMNRQQVMELLKSGKIYIDFGNHPGKDRIPREAAMSGCCIITGKQGSAGFYEDISIDEKAYKFTQKDKDIKNIIHVIKSILNDYQNEILKFEEYRNNILKEREEFVRDTINLFF